MRRRVLTATLTVLTGALWASAAPAATPLILAPKLAPVSVAALGRGLPVSLNLGGMMAPALAQGSSALQPNGASAAHGIQLELSRGRNWDPSAELFPAPASLDSMYLAGTNTFAGASFALGRDVSLSAGHMALGLGALSDSQPSGLSRDLAARLGTNLRSAGTTSANLNWNLSDWAGVGITASHSNGDASLLGSVGGLRSALPAESSALGISARVGFAEGWVTTLTYAEGVTQLDLSRDKIMTQSDPLRSEAYGIGLAKTGLFGNDALGIALSRPLQYTGSNNLGALNANFALASTQARESDVALGYVTTFLDGSLALQANAAYQVNAAGARGQNAVAGVARAKLNF
jgi:hypothetical protein